MGRYKTLNFVECETVITVVLPVTSGLESSQYYMDAG
jgi:hypothetical protein